MLRQVPPRASQSGKIKTIGKREPEPPAEWARGTDRINPAPAPSGKMMRPKTDPGEATQYARNMADLEVKFEQALSQVHMFFQPIVHAHDRAIFGYEALLRSKNPDLPHPGALLDAAEKLNRLDKLGRVVRAKVAKVAAQAERHRGYIFVNLHALDLLDKSLSSPFSPLARIAGRIVLEITERASLDTVNDIRFRVAELRKMGYRIAIDDLGAGHKRMNLFTPLDTDFVKLDMSLVRDIDSHPMKQELVTSVVKLCKQQGILVIGEGVETQPECDFLIGIGCDLLQGYHIARPGPPFVDVSQR